VLVVERERKEGEGPGKSENDAIRSPLVKESFFLFIRKVERKNFTFKVISLSGFVSSFL